jgi:hypothetical protein
MDKGSNLVIARGTPADQNRIDQANRQAAMFDADGATAGMRWQIYRIVASLRRLTVKKINN